MQSAYLVFRPVPDSTVEPESDSGLSDGYDAAYEALRSFSTPQLVKNPSFQLEVFQTSNAAIAKVSVQHGDEMMEFLGDSCLSDVVDSDDQYYVALAESLQNAANYFYMLSE